MSLKIQIPIVKVFNPSHATGLFLYPLKTSEKQRFSDVFRGYRKSCDMKYVNVFVVVPTSDRTIDDVQL